MAAFLLFLLLLVLSTTLLLLIGPRLIVLGALFVFVPMAELFAFRAWQLAL